MLPAQIKNELQTQVQKVKQLHDKDLVAGYGEVYLPQALGKKYSQAAKEFRWPYVFPAKKLSKDPRTGRLRRHHALESGLQKAVKAAANRSGITKRIGCHTFRHHADVKTTEIYTHVMDKDLNAVASPLDSLLS